jgi:hypothetical protein
MKCPGQDTLYWKPGAIYEVPCPQCGAKVEFFKDDTARKCPKCQHRFVNPNMDFGCAAYCQYAEQCIGTLPEEFLKQKEDLLKDRVAIEMKRYFKSDFKRIGHATRVARHAERINRAEGGNPAVVLCAAYLHDIGIVRARKSTTAARPGIRSRKARRWPARFWSGWAPRRRWSMKSATSSATITIPGRRKPQLQSALRCGPDRQPGRRERRKTASRPEKIESIDRQREFFDRKRPDRGP